MDIFAGVTGSFPEVKNWLGEEKAAGKMLAAFLVFHSAMLRGQYFPCNGVMPWRYVDFLEFAAARLLLHRVSGGYEFIHGLVKDHFAARYREWNRMVR